jgi:hypothetical protein
MYCNSDMTDASLERAPLVSCEQINKVMIYVGIRVATRNSKFLFDIFCKSHK